MQDTPITRVSIADMSPEEAQSHLEEIRERRLTYHRLLERTKIVSANELADKLKTKLDKQLPLAIKALESVDKAMEKAEMKIVSIIALRTEIQQLTGVDICEHMESRV
jgi:chromosome segregation and condensation protein ScpB